MAGPERRVGLARAGAEEGVALLVAIALMAVMLGTGLAVAATADRQTAASGTQRVEESSLNLGEAAAMGQVFELSRSWPSEAAPAPASCSSATATTVAGCPSAESLRASFGSSDYAAGATWTTEVRDNGGSAGAFYSEALAEGQPRHDASGPTGLPDGKVWVRAQAVVRGRLRSIVTLVQAGEVPRPFPRNTITAGWFSTSNEGSKAIVDTNGGADQFQAGPVAVRCTLPAPSSGCMNYNPSKGQMAPRVEEYGYTGGPALSEEGLDELRRLAQSKGTYYASGCPASLTGPMVFIQNGDCSYTGNSTFNTTAAPGMVTIRRGTLTLGGATRYNGLIHAANEQGAGPANGPVVSTDGNAEIVGSVSIDGNGGLEAGSSGTNITFDASVFNAVKGYGDAGAVQGSWRELTAG